MYKLYNWFAKNIMFIYVTNLFMLSGLVFTGDNYHCYNVFTTKSMNSVCVNWFIYCCSECHTVE